MLIGRDEGAEDFIIRYFTIPAGGHSAFENHPHQHGVVITHGRGRVLLGDTWSAIGAGDAVFVGAERAASVRGARRCAVRLYLRDPKVGQEPRPTLSSAIADCRLQSAAQ